VFVTKEFLRRQIEEREQQRRAEKERNVREDLELERQLQQQQQVQMPTAQQRVQPAPQSKPCNNTWTAPAVSTQPAAPPAVSARYMHAVQLGLSPGHTVLDGDPVRPPPKGYIPPQFWPICVVAKWLDGSRCHLVRRYPLAQATLC